MLMRKKQHIDLNKRNEQNCLFLQEKKEVKTLVCSLLIEPHTFTTTNSSILWNRASASNSCQSVIKCNRNCESAQNNTSNVALYGSLEPITFTCVVCTSYIHAVDLPCFQSSCSAFCVTNCYFTIKTSVKCMETKSQSVAKPEHLTVVYALRTKTVSL